MTIALADSWITSESGFYTADQTRLFFRCWQPRMAREGCARRAFVYLHRGHEHSGRIQGLVEEFNYHNDWAFAWDARGHGYSPGERGDAPSFEILANDFDLFIQHIQQTYQIELENIIIIANSVGAVIAATWLHDYAPRIRGVVMAAAAFDINLYVPFAKAGLRFARRFKPDLFVTSYIRSSMLTHSKTQSLAYDQDPLITKNISARVLLDLADTANRIVYDAAAIEVPILMLVADKDYVVKQKPQKKFFERLSSKLKRYIIVKDSFHAIFYEQDIAPVIKASRDFIEQCYAQPLIQASRHYKDDTESQSAAQYRALLNGQLGNSFTNTFFGIQKLMLSFIGRLSNGMAIGLKHGFDSGASLDYVYGNQANGKLLLGKFIDRGYLDAVGWRGIRLRKLHLQQALAQLISQSSSDKTDSPNRAIRILDIAAGSGRYALETMKRFQDKNIQLTLRDLMPHNLAQAKLLAEQLQLTSIIEYQCCDAFDDASYAQTQPLYDIVIVSGLYELFSENAIILQSLRGIQKQLKPGGHIIYTAQPWHPQLVMIAKTLTNHLGKPWTMRPRPQSEMDALVASIDCKKIRTQIGLEGIFTVSVAQYSPTAARPETND
jgi:alpha-beta hydrolase superfamily lysophospholipase/2-polyprenyl-3-methyl-5-hydroxy-6-metoxy-1,4-benzoquinol methylase